MIRPRLVPTNADEPTRQEIAIAAIEQDMRQWRSPWPDVTAKGWQPYTGSTRKSANDVGEITRRQYRVVAQGRVPAWRRMYRWLSKHVLGVRQ